MNWYKSMSKKTIIKYDVIKICQISVSLNMDILYFCILKKNYVYNNKYESTILCLMYNIRLNNISI